MKLPASKTNLSVAITVLLLLSLAISYYVLTHQHQSRTLNLPFVVAEGGVDSILLSQLRDSSQGMKLLHDNDEIFDMTTGEAFRTIYHRMGMRVKFNPALDTNQLLSDNHILHDGLLNLWIQKYNKPNLYFSVHDQQIFVTTHKTKYNN